MAHTLAFESMFLYALGVIVQPPCYDTIAAAQLTLKSSTTFRGLSDSGLKTLVPQLFHVELPDFETVTAGRFFDELDPQDKETVRYACADSDYALRLYHLFNGWFDQYLPRHRRIVEQIESPTSVYCGLMRYNGLLMDRAAMEAKQAEAEERISAIREEIAFLIGDVEIGANASTSAFKSYLYKDLGLPVVKTTAKYQEAADDETMILLAAWCRENRPELTRLFELVQEYRRWGKIKGTYLDGYLRHINSATGRIHPDLMPLGTETGRFAARNPNLQNMPRKGSDPIGIRNMLVAPEGYQVMELDYSQIELRVGAFYCRDARMLETYRGGGDIHAQTTSVIYNIPIEQAADKSAAEYKDRRAIAKGCNFGCFYGLFPKGLQGMKIFVKLTRAENTALLGAGPVELDLEEYLCGVVPSEIYESSHMEALKAQAVAARTFAVKRAMAGTVVDDTTSFQAYRAPLAESSPRSRQAVVETAGQVLTYGGEVIDCFYSASNGGTCKRSGEVWSRDYPYYVNKPDPWDTAARTEKSTNPSHGVGLSQVGCMWAAKQGVPYNEILAFYYSGAALVHEYGTGSVVGFEEETGGFAMNLHTLIFTNNACYKAGRKITPKGIMVHSTGANNPWLKRYVGPDDGLLGKNQYNSCG